MELLLRLSSGLPREIASEAFFRIRPPTEKDFLEACKEGKNLLLLEQWLFFGLVDVSLERNRAIILASEYGNTFGVSLLLDYGADATTRDNLPICFAAHHGHLTIVSLLLAHGADPSAQNGWPLYAAARHWHTRTVSLLRAHGATSPRLD